MIVAIKTIGNILLVTNLLQFMFAVMGVQMFKVGLKMSVHHRHLWVPKLLKFQFFKVSICVFSKFSKRQIVWFRFRFCVCGFIRVFFFQNFVIRTLTWIFRFHGSKNSLTVNSYKCMRFFWFLYLVLLAQRCCVIWRLWFFGLRFELLCFFVCTAIPYLDISTRY